ncbi:MAG: VPLPA-CTERM sorting domain-containing protein [Desulfuromonadales bacterium]|nr:VPLPA-CTERM sorting domain-containing protein [Desulfuromonadales bacterium]
MKKVVMTVAMMAVTAGSAQAALVAKWDNSNAPGNQGYTEGGGSAHVTATVMARSTGLAGNIESNSLSSVGFNSAEKFIQFGFTVESGYQTKLNDLWIGTKSSANGPGSIGVYTSRDNFTTAICTISENTGQVNSKIDLSSLGAITGEFAIRLKAVGTKNATGYEGIADTSTFSVTNYTGTQLPTELDGSTTTTPIPAAIWLMGSGLLGLAGVRKRRG